MVAIFVLIKKPLFIMCVRVCARVLCVPAIARDALLVACDLEYFSIIQKKVFTSNKKRRKLFFKKKKETTRTKRALHYY